MMGWNIGDQHIHPLSAYTDKAAWLSHFDVVSTPAHLYETARAAGGAGVPGCTVPAAHEDEPVEWAGDNGYYAICRATE